MPRAFLIVMDSVGCGGAPDASDFGDDGANTLGHIARECAAGRAEVGRSGPLAMPNLDALGLGAAVRLACYGNDGLWKTRKTNNRFSVVSHSPWKSQKARFPHSHSLDDERRGKVEIQIQDSHFPTAPNPYSN